MREELAASVAERPDGGFSMDTGAARAMFEEYASAMVYLEVKNEDGDRKIGSGFHVGEGVFVTARHVVDKCEVLEVGMTEHTYVPIENADTATTFISKDGVNQPVHEVRNGILTLKRGPFLHQDSGVDVAVFQVEQIDPLTPVVRLGSHLDDWLGESDFVLTEAVILGYPPIPKTMRPTLVGTRAEVSTIVDRYDAPHVHFVLSAMARGGFSGGIVLSEYGYALGVVTNSLGSDMKPAELGYMTAVGVEPIYACLAQHRMLPDCQAEGWDDFWNSSTVYFCREFDEHGGAQLIGSVELFDDGKRLYVEINCDDDDAVLNAAVEQTYLQLSGLTLSKTEQRPGIIRIDVQGSYDSNRGPVQAAAHDLITFFEAQGYLKAGSVDWPPS
jgi:hypothetical protein